MRNARHHASSDVQRYPLRLYNWKLDWIEANVRQGVIAGMLQEMYEGVLFTQGIIAHLRQSVVNYLLHVQKVAPHMNRITVQKCGLYGFDLGIYELRRIDIKDVVQVQFSSELVTRVRSSLFVGICMDQHPPAKGSLGAGYSVCVNNRRDYENDNGQRVDDQERGSKRPGGPGITWWAVGVTAR